MIGAPEPIGIRMGTESWCVLSVRAIGGFTDGGFTSRADHRGMTNWLCTLQDAAGRVETCPGKKCPFWLDDECAIGGFRADLPRNPSLVAHLLRLRAQIAGGPPSIFGLLPPRLRA